MNKHAATRPRWTRIAALMILAFVSLEGISQLVIYTYAGEWFRSLNAYTWSPYGLVRNNPALTSPTIHINPQGFRNDAPMTQRKDERTFRVLLMGGSVLYSGIAPNAFVNQGRIPNKQTIAGYLQRQLEADPAFTGLDIEVINAAVNFNRIVEVSTAYLAEYAHWDPDMVIVFGSANNFSERPDANSAYNHAHRLQAPHPWGLEYDRIVNGQGVLSLGENVLNRAAETFASVALAKKLVITLLDKAFAFVRAHTPGQGPVEAAVSRLKADQAELEFYVRDYFVYANAIIAAARTHDHQIAFFWEHYLADLKGTKPLSPDEKYLYPIAAANRTEGDTTAMAFFRRRATERFAAANVPFIDPLEDLKSSPETIFIDYLHYTPRGNELMSSVVYRQLGKTLRAQAAARLAALR